MSGPDTESEDLMQRRRSAEERIIKLREERDRLRARLREIEQLLPDSSKEIPGEGSKNSA